MEKIESVESTVISISIVSHVQMNLVVQLLADLETHCKDVSIELILTLNIEESLPFIMDGFSFPIKVVRNATPMGFAANHNQAFSYATGRFFCVLNPDIRLDRNPFIVMSICLLDPSIGVVAPLVLGADGGIEDSARRFPGPFKMICKAFGLCKSHDYVIDEKLIRPDWAGGMFLLFPRSIFEKLGGFDQRYFLYYEDVDICARLRLLGYDVVICSEAKVTHYAQRSSHRSFRYFRWHIASMMRFFFSSTYWRLQLRKLRK